MKAKSRFRLEMAGEIPPGEQLRVVVMWEPSNLDLAWRTAGSPAL